MGQPETPLSAALSSGRTAIVKLLIKSGVSVKGINVLAEAKNYDIAKFFIDELGANVNGYHHNSKTPLCSAIDRSNDELVRLLLDVGADVTESCCLTGFKPLWLAMNSSYVAMVSLLLENGADPNGAIFKGLSPLQHAIRLRSFELVVLLMKFTVHLLTQKVKWEELCSSLPQQKRVAQKLSAC